MALVYQWSIALVGAYAAFGAGYMFLLSSRSVESRRVIDPC